MKKILSLLLLLPLFTFSQNVGISSNILFNPQYTLDVDGITKISNYASIGVNPNSSYRLYVYNSSSNYARLGSNQYGLYARGSSSAVWGYNNTSGGHSVRAQQNSTGYSVYADGLNSRNYFQGNVGIGTLNPVFKLDVDGDVEFGSGTSNLEFIKNGTTFEIRHHDPGVSWNNISLNPYGGNVGIGTTNPVHLLDVRGNMYLSGQKYINNVSPTIYLQDTDHRSGMIHMNSNLLYFLNGSGVNSTTWTPNNSEWPLTVNMTNDDISVGGIMAVGDWGSCAPNRRLIIGEYISCNPVIRPSLNFLGYVGTPSSYFWEMYSDAYLATDGYYYVSDKRFKTNITPIPNALEKILSINGVSYDIKKGSIADNGRDDIYDRVGFLAQDIREIIPSAVREVSTEKKLNASGEDINSNSSDSYLSVNYSAVIPLLVEAIKEQQKMIDELKERINSIEIKE